MFLLFAGEPQDLERVIQRQAHEWATATRARASGWRTRRASAWVSSAPTRSPTAWRITRVLGGVNWNPTLRTTHRAWANVRAGEYLLAVNGIPLDADQRLRTA